MSLKQRIIGVILGLVWFLLGINITLSRVDKTTSYTIIEQLIMIPTTAISKLLEITADLGTIAVQTSSVSIVLILTIIFTIFSYITWGILLVFGCVQLTKRISGKVYSLKMLKKQ